MNWLQAVKTGARLVFGFLEPFVNGVQQAVPAAGTTFANIVTIIGTVERTAEIFGGADGTGAQKLEAASPLIADIIRHSELVAGRNVINETKFMEGVKQIVSGVVAILNAIAHKE